MKLPWSQFNASSLHNIFIELIECSISPLGISQWSPIDENMARMEHSTLILRLFVRETVWIRFFSFLLLYISPFCYTCCLISSTSRFFQILLFKDLFIFILCVWVFASTNVWVPHVDLVSEETRRGNGIPWNWSHKGLWAGVGAETQPRPSAGAASAPVTC